MFRVYISLFIVFLFYVLTPGVFLSLPKGGSVTEKAAVHAIVFAIIFHYTYKIVENYLYSSGKPEGFFAPAKKTVMRTPVKPVMRAPVRPVMRAPVKPVMRAPVKPVIRGPVKAPMKPFFKK
jgi:hypothetical protein